MSIYIFPSILSKDIEKLIRVVGKTTIYHAMSDTKEIDKVYYYNKELVSMRLMPLNWDNMYKPSSLPNVVFDDVYSKFSDKNVYIHKFVYVGLKEWEFVKGKLKNKDVFISVADDDYHYTWNFIESGLKRCEFSLLKPNDLDSIYSIKQFKLKRLLINK